MREYRVQMRSIRIEMRSYQTINKHFRFGLISCVNRNNYHDPPFGNTPNYRTVSELLEQKTTVKYLKRSSELVSLDAEKL